MARTKHDPQPLPQAVHLIQQELYRYRCRWFQAVYKVKRRPWDKPRALKTEQKLSEEFVSRSGMKFT